MTTALNTKSEFERDVFCGVSGEKDLSMRGEPRRSRVGADVLNPALERHGAWSSPTSRPLAQRA